MSTHAIDTGQDLSCSSPIFTLLLAVFGLLREMCSLAAKYSTTFVCLQFQPVPVIYSGFFKYLPAVAQKYGPKI